MNGQTQTLSEAYPAQPQAAPREVSAQGRRTDGAGERGEDHWGEAGQWDGAEERLGLRGCVAIAWLGSNANLNFIHRDSIIYVIKCFVLDQACLFQFNIERFHLRKLTTFGVDKRPQRYRRIDCGGIKKAATPSTVLKCVCEILRIRSGFHVKKQANHGDLSTSEFMHRNGNGSLLFRSQKSWFLRLIFGAIRILNARNLRSQAIHIIRYLGQLIWRIGKSPKQNRCSAYSKSSNYCSAKNGASLAHLPIEAKHFVCPISSNQDE
jgi:hypothetical protein